MALLPLALLPIIFLPGCNRGAHPAQLYQRAPDFTVSDGTTSVHLANYRGKVVLLNFWWSQCAPCIAELPSLLQLHHDDPNLIVLGVSIDEDPDSYSAFIRRRHVDFITVRDPKQATPSLFHRPQWRHPPQIRRPNRLVRPRDSRIPQEPLSRASCYHPCMTTVDILFRYVTPPTEAAIFALADTREVYGIRRLLFDRAARTVRVEYDATRLNAAAVAKLVRQAGLDIEEELSLIPPQPAPEPAPAA
jgi:thiol-disulfide isomerase/thioredoxin